MPHASATPGKTTQKSKSSATQHEIGDETDREEMIAVAAYFRAEHRGFGEGDPVEDWLAAEAEIDSMLNNRKAIKAH